MGQGKNILVCPLDWGLGHATRMVPVIEMLGKKGANVIIAADNRPLEFLAPRFPKNTVIQLKGYRPNYPSNNNMAWAMLKSLPEMVLTSRKAKRKLETIIKEHHIDAIISDNRYELSTSIVPTIFITHQLNIQTSGWQTIVKPIINRIIHHYVKKFDEVWIPDLPDNIGLSGDLSKSDKTTKRFFNIGLLSRFNKSEITSDIGSVDILIILSGPEPQRTILEKLLLQQALKADLLTVMLLGKPEDAVDREIENVRLISHLSDAKFASLIQSAKLVISRPGYSTLMDLAIIGKKAVFIPTPGQTEQEYLADKLFEEGIAFSQTQKDFDLQAALKNQKHYNGLLFENQPELLELRINNLLKIC